MAEMQEEQSRDWKDEYKEKWLETKLGMEGLMLGRVQRQQRTEETLARHTRKLAGVEEASPQPEEDEMGVSIGNKVFNHYEAPATKPSSPIVESGLLQKAAIAAALLTGGGGLGYLAAQAAIPAVAGVLDTDTDTISVIDFPE
jgi:hypothetical protein